MNERESQQGKVVTVRPPKRLVQLWSLLISDPTPSPRGVLVGLTPQTKLEAPPN